MQVFFFSAVGFNRQSAVSHALSGWFVTALTEFRYPKEEQIYSCQN